MPGYVWQRCHSPASVTHLLTVHTAILSSSDIIIVSFFNTHSGIPQEICLQVASRGRTTPCGRSTLSDIPHHDLRKIDLQAPAHSILTVPTATTAFASRDMHPALQRSRTPAPTLEVCRIRLSDSCLMWVWGAHSSQLNELSCDVSVLFVAHCARQSKCSFPILSIDPTPPKAQRRTTHESLAVAIDQPTCIKANKYCNPGLVSCQLQLTIAHYWPLQSIVHSQPPASATP
ncbi:hypothetical protein P280DRAFT_213735 [Massarina eburnea CBS 473.64]|uniref:Uncharacterized protein n=1 Tax=Massarina eburnea CBS 473.64 TaxID=1395130 RepID=A0A6A6SBU0_9PLEO|nr:hypothetical protein P280DRAFT_213735 [Massarina eburnea CBS 473.64]